MTMKKTVKKVLSLIMVVCVCLTSVDLSVFASEPIRIQEFQYKNLNEEIQRQETEDEILYVLKKENLESVFTKQELKNLLPEILIVPNDTEVMEVPITWNLTNIEEEIPEGGYSLIPELPDGYVWGDMVTGNDIRLTVTYKKQEDTPFSNDEKEMEDSPAEDDSTVKDGLVTEFRIEWTDKEAQEDVLTVKPGNNYHWIDPEDDYASEGVTHSAAQGRLRFKISDTSPIEAGKLEIRIPKSIFENRGGKPYGECEIGLSNSSSLNYDYRVDQESKEIVIYNTKEISEAHELNIDFEYRSVTGAEYPSEIQDGYTKEWKATANINGKTYESNLLTVKYELEVALEEIKLEKIRKYETWDPVWGEKPENAEEYYYVAWGLSGKLDDIPHTKPFKVSFSREKGEGELVAWAVLDRESAPIFYTDDYYFKEVPVIFNDPALLESLGYGGIENGTFTMKIKEPWNGRKGDDNTVNTIFVVKYKKGITSITETGKIKIENLYSEDRPYIKELSVAGTYQYVNSEFHYPEGEYLAKKSAGREGYGVLDKIEVSEEKTEIDLAKGLGDCYSNQFWVTGGILTLDGEKENIDHYGKKEYTIIGTDDFLAYGNRRLNDEEYNFTKIIFTIGSVTDYVYDEDTGSGMEKPYDGRDIGKVEIQYQCGRNSDWKKLADVERTEGEKLEGKLPDGEIIASNGSGNLYLDCPENVTGIRTVIKTKKHSFDFSMEVDVQLRVSQQMKAECLNSKEKKLTNVNTLEVLDSENNWVNSAGRDSIEGTLKEEIIKRDEEVFGDNGKYGMHSSAAIRLSRIRLMSDSEKELKATQDKEHSRFVFDYTLEAYEGSGETIRGPGGFEELTSALTLEEFKKLDLLKEHRDGWFYDLLPLGMEVDISSIEVSREGMLSADHYGADIIKFPHAVEFEKNYKGSGRTMMKVYFTVPEGVGNIFYNYDYGFCTGADLKFRAYYSYDSVIDYGDEVKNLAAYKLSSGQEITEAYPDDPKDTSYIFENDKEKEWFYDLDKDGNPENTVKDTLYMKAYRRVSGLTASELSFSKSVKSETDTEYKKDTQTLAGKRYSYRLRMGKSEGASLSNLIFYDILEDAYQDNSYWWKGTIEDIDVSQLELKGIKPVIYYTNQDIELREGTDTVLQGDANIDDSTIWTPWPEDDTALDKKGIKAIAVDMRKDKNGNPYTLKGGSTVSVVVNMIAPTENTKEYVENQAKAYNDAWISSTTRDDTGGETQALQKSTETTILMKQPELEIHKTSDPASGSSDKPAEVQNKDLLTYDVAVSNKELLTAVKDVLVEDTIPEGLEADTEGIRYYYNDQENETHEVNDNVVTLTSDGQKLSFRISELAANTTIHFRIPTTVTATEEEAVYVNQAFLTGVGETPYELSSEITYHEKKVPLADFTFTKQNKQGEALSGAKFVLCELDCRDSSHAHGQQIEVDENGQLSETETCFKNPILAESEETGTVAFRGLKTNREYRLVEYDAPGDYLTPNGQWIVAYHTENARFEVTGSVGNPPAFQAEEGGGFSVRNYKTGELPLTGGRGGRLFLLAGASMMLAAGYWLYRRRKRI